MMHFSWEKTPISWTERVFDSSINVLLTLIRIDGASYLNGYCSLMFFILVFNAFYESEKLFLCFLFAN